VPTIEMYADDGSMWYTPPTNPQAVISAENDTVEGRVALIDLMDFNVATISIITARNIVGWNNDIDTTSGWGCNGIDSVSGTPGNFENAWFREFSDSDIDTVYTFQNDRTMPVSNSYANAVKNGEWPAGGFINVSEQSYSDSTARDCLSTDTDSVGDWDITSGKDSTEVTPNEVNGIPEFSDVLPVILGTIFIVAVSMRIRRKKT